MDAQKENQKSSFDKLYDHPAGAGDFQTPVGKWLWQKQMEKGLSLAGMPVQGLTGLSVCCGLGVEAHWMSQQGALVTATDLSPVAVRRVREQFPLLKTQVADAEKLPFADKSFDFAFVHHGLHHLPRPLAGLYEIIRVARKFVIMWEAQDNYIVRILTAKKLFGLLPTGGHYEPSGNYVYRFSRRELAKLAKSLYLKDVRFSSAWHHNNVVVEMLHAKLFKGEIGLRTAKLMYSGVDALAGRWGNNLVAVFEL